MTTPPSPAATVTAWLSDPAGAPYQESLQDLPPDLAEALMRSGQQRNWRRGQTVMHQGAPCDALVVALEGRLAVTLGSSDGRDTLLRWLDAGELLGLPAVLGGLPATVTIVAQGQARTLHVPRADFIALLHQHPEGAIAVAVLLSRRLGELFRFVERNSSRSLAQRLGFALQRLARSQGQPDGAGGVRLQVTQAELANAAGASRQRVHLALKQLQAQGQLQLGYGWVKLLAPKP
jgi:CRP/FNR family transcriptional regulator, cyclic AMP receptor protein